MQMHAEGHVGTQQKLCARIAGLRYLVLLLYTQKLMLSNACIE